MYYYFYLYLQKVFYFLFNFHYWCFSIVATTTSSTGIQTYNFNFIAISHNILTTPTFNLAVHGNAHLERDPFQPNPVLVLNGSNEYVEFNNHTNSGCINDLIGCQTGFTIKIAVNLIKLDHQYKTVILSNGNQFMNGTGLALYFYHGHLYGYVSTNKTWKIDVDYKVEVNKWHTYQMSWSVSHGLTIMIDGHQVATATHATANSFTTVQHHTLTIGKLHSTSYTTSMKITGLTIWQATHQVLIQQGLLTTGMQADVIASLFICFSIIFLNHFHFDTNYIEILSLKFELLKK